MHLKTREELLEDFTEREITMAEQFATTSERLELPFQQRPLPRVAEDSNALLRKRAEEGYWHMVMKVMKRGNVSLMNYQSSIRQDLPIIF